MSMHLLWKIKTCKQQNPLVNYHTEVIFIFICFIVCILGRRTCPMTKSLCVLSDENVYFFVCNVQNWFEARKICQTHKSQMVTLKNTKGAVETFSQKLLQKGLHCNEFWMGFSMFAWFHLSDGKQQ